MTAITLGVLLSLTAVVSAFAAQGTTYTIDEIDGMQLTVGTEMMAVTRNTDSSDGYFNLPNNGYNEVMKKMKDGDIYLLATDSQQSITVAVSMFENKDTKKIDNYNRLTESELSDIVVGYQQSSDGTTYSASTVDEVVQDIVWIDFESDETLVWNRCKRQKYQRYNPEKRLGRNRKRLRRAKKHSFVRKIYKKRSAQKLFDVHNHRSGGSCNYYSDNYSDCSKACAPPQKKVKER